MARSRRYLAVTITDVDYEDVTVLLANTTTKAESLFHSLKQRASGIGLHENANKMKYMCSKREGAISTLNCSPLKLGENIYIYIYI